MTDAPTAEVYYDPYDAEIDDDPYPVWKRLRDEAPLYRNDEHDFYALSRWEDVEPALIDWETYRSGKGTIFEIIKAVTETGLEMPPGILLFEDPPIHDLHRGLLSRVFTPRRMAAIEPLIQQFSAWRSTRSSAPASSTSSPTSAGSCPMRTIGYLLGIPEEAQEAIRNNTDARLALVDGKPPEVGDETFESHATT